MGRSSISERDAAFQWVGPPRWCCTGFSTTDTLESKICILTYKRFCFVYSVQLAAGPAGPPPADTEGGGCLMFQPQVKQVPLPPEPNPRWEQPKAAFPPTGVVSNKTSSDQIVSGVPFRRPTGPNGNCDAGRELTLWCRATGTAASAGFSKVSIHRLLLWLCFTCMNVLVSQRSALHSLSEHAGNTSVHPSCIILVSHFVYFYCKFISAVCLSLTKSSWMKRSASYHCLLWGLTENLL